MKNFTLLIALFISITLNAQDYPGKRTQLLVGKKITVKPLKESLHKRGYQYFFTNEKLTRIYENSNVPVMHSKYEALVGKTFEVLSVKPVEEMGKKFDLLTLKGDNDLLLYHLLEDNGPEYFIFTVEGGLIYPDDFYCDFIVEKHSPETGMTDYIIEAYPWLLLMKTKSKELSGYLLYASVVQGGSLDKSNGVVFTLDNGAKIERPDHIPQIGLNSNSDYKYSAYIELTAKEIELLKTHTITNYQIGVIKQEVRTGYKFKNSLPCLLTK